MIESIILITKKQNIIIEAKTVIKNMIETKKIIGANNNCAKYDWNDKNHWYSTKNNCYAWNKKVYKFKPFYLDSKSKFCGKSITAVKIQLFSNLFIPNNNNIYGHIVKQRNWIRQNGKFSISIFFSYFSPLRDLT